MKLRIVGYESGMAFRCHRCEDENGEKMYVDLMVDAGIEVPEEAKETEETYTHFCRSLIGKEVECSRLSAFVLIGHDVRLMP